MSFYVHARHARDPHRRMAYRLSSFRSCIQLYRWLVKRRYSETLNRFDSAFGLADQSEVQLLAAISALEAERHAFLQRLAAFERRRIRQKARGRRTPLPSEIAALYAADFFTVPAAPRPAV